jgi:hypothetical protein
MGPETIKKHLELYGLTQDLGDNAGDSDWSVLSEDYEADITSLCSRSDFYLFNEREGLPDTGDPDEYEDFVPVTFEDAKDDGNRVPNHHQGYREWQEVIEPGEDAE